MNKAPFGDRFLIFSTLDISNLMKYWYFFWNIGILSRNVISSLTIIIKLYLSFHVVIFRLVAPTEGSLEWDILEVKRLFDHQDNILSLANINGKLNVYMLILCKILYLLT